MPSVVETEIYLGIIVGKAIRRNLVKDPDKNESEKVISSRRYLWNNFVLLLLWLVCLSIDFTKLYICINMY